VASVPGARRIGPVTPDERCQVTVRVRRRAPLVDMAGVAEFSPSFARPHLSRAQYAAWYGADPADLDLVAAFAQSHHLTVMGVSAERRSVFLSGRVADVATTFDADVAEYQSPQGRYRGRIGELTVPAVLHGVVEGVFGLDTRAVAEPHFQRFEPGRIRARVPGVSFTPLDIARCYNFPTAGNGTGQCIALIELGGGYRPADLKTYFRGLGLAMPDVVTVRVDGGRNAPSDADSADGEVMLDIEVAAAIASGARIAVYFAPNTDRGFLDALTLAVHDPVNKPSVISISWGGPEEQWTAQAMASFDDCLQSAAALGISVCVAAGDAGSGDGMHDGLAHVDFPASSPHALACGGTHLVARAGRISSEVVWNNSSSSATGGGVSSTFPLPAYQAGVGVPRSASGFRGRGVPDVSGNADPATGYRVRVDGEEMVIGGTSAVAPLWAGLIALINQQVGQPVGLIHPLLYNTTRAQSLCRDIVTGRNGSYSAHKGWDPCTGWGSPDGAALLAQWQGVARRAA
jgi:kumamolisin